MRFGRRQTEMDARRAHLNKILQADMIKHEVHYKGNVNLKPLPFIIKNTEPALAHSARPIYEACLHRRHLGKKMPLILLLKWFTKSSQRASVDVCGNYLESELVKRSKVEKRSLGLFLLTVMRLQKWDVLACNYFIVRFELFT